MAKITVEPGSSASLYPVLPPDSRVQVEAVSIEQRTAQNRNGETWEKLEFKFRIVAIPDQMADEFGALEGSHIWGSVPLRLTSHPDNKLRQWAEALIGVELGEGYELDTDDLVGKRARALISNYSKKTGEIAHQVAGLLPAGGDVQAAPAPAAAAALAAVGGGSTGGGWIKDDDDPPF